MSAFSPVRTLGTFDASNNLRPREVAELKRQGIPADALAGPVRAGYVVFDQDGFEFEHHHKHGVTGVRAFLFLVTDRQGVARDVVACRFALFAAAGEMARVALNLPWAENEAERAAALCFDAWRSTLGGEGPGEFVAAMEAIRAAVEKHGESRFRLLHEVGPDLPANGQGVRDLIGSRFLRDDELYWGFTTTGWREALAGIADIKGIAAMLADRGMLLVSKSDRANRYAMKVEGRTVAVYAVRASALSF